ncbi:putative peptidoglycan glycosyltransferase FtsW [Trichinella pseudospiralis]
MTEEQGKLSNRELICFLAGGHSEHFQWGLKRKYTAHKFCRTVEWTTDPVAELAGAERVNEIDEFSNMAPSSGNLPSNLTTPIVSNGAGHQLTLVTVDGGALDRVRFRGWRIDETLKRADVQRPGRTSTGVHRLGVTARRSGTNCCPAPCRVGHCCIGHCLLLTPACANVESVVHYLADYCCSFAVQRC